MKVEIKENLVEVSLEYPKLMIAADGFIVLFYKKGCGLRIDDKYSYSSNWAMNLFKDFKGTITITQ